MMRELEPPDLHHLNAAEGWIGLSSYSDAEHELEQLSADVQSHPEVLRVRYHLLERRKDWRGAVEIAKQLCVIVPDMPLGWINHAFALHELSQTREAYSVLRPVVDRFPQDPIVLYNLACYCCRLGEMDEARSWIKKAVALAGPETIKKMALKDPDLKEMQSEIQAM